MLPKEEEAGMDVWKERVQHDISELKNGQKRLESENVTIKDSIRDLQLSDKLQDQEISTIKAALSDIKDDTNFIRRKITGAIITAAITAAIAGIIGIAITNIF